MVARAKDATLRVEIAPDARTHVTYLSEGTNGTVMVQSTADGSAPVALAPGQERVFAPPLSVHGPRPSESTGS
jgi:hypothetical protein